MEDSRKQCFMILFFQGGKVMKTKNFWKEFKKQKTFQLFVLSGMLFLFIFKYIPMFGIIIGFKDYKLTDGIAGFFTSPWNNFKHFKDFFNYYNFWQLIKNTLSISLLKLVFSLIAPLFLAIVINEITSKKLKRFAQTATYLPHFISWIVIASIAFTFFSQNDGVVNVILEKLHIIKQAIPFLSSPDYFYGMAAFTGTWKESGWWAIIYLSAMAGIDPGLYESAQMDGATRMQRIRHITLPAIKGSIIVVTILSIGSLLGGGLVGSNFEQCYLMGNTSNAAASEIIQTYAFKVGMLKARYDYATAIDLIQSLISVVLIFGSNALSKKFTDQGLF
jgi:putative aldouronate transport system permease protein